MMAWLLNQYSLNISAILSQALEKLGCKLGPEIDCRCHEATKNWIPLKKAQ